MLKRYIHKPHLSQCYNIFSYSSRDLNEAQKKKPIGEKNRSCSMMFNDSLWEQTAKMWKKKREMNLMLEEQKGQL